MAGYALTVTRPQPSLPYITADEYKQAPTGVDVTNLVKGDAGASAAELVNTIGRASAWADNLCNQVLGATTDTEGARITPSRDGTLRIHPQQTPIIAVTAVSFGSTPQTLAAVSDLTGIWVEETQLVVPLVTGMWSSAGPLQFSAGPGGRSPLFVQWTVVSGYANSALAASATAGATTLTVADGTGLLPGSTQLTIYDGSQTETVTVASAYATGSVTVPLTAGLAHTHAQTGVSVSAMPPDVKQAVILLTSALIKTRGASAIVMASTREAPDRKVKGQAGGMEEVELAKEILASYTRVR